MHCNLEDQSIVEPVCQSTNPPNRPSARQVANQFINQTILQSISPSINQTIYRSNKQLTNQLVNRQERKKKHKNEHSPDSKVHEANMGPTRVLSVPDGTHVGPINLAIRVNNDNIDKGMKCFVRVG